jgi:hypothetical protein
LGRDCDKFAECSLTVQPSGTVSTPGIAECPVTYECRILRIDVVKGGLDPRMAGRAFPGGRERPRDAGGLIRVGRIHLVLDRIDKIHRIFFSAFLTGLTGFTGSSSLHF